MTPRGRAILVAAKAFEALAVTVALAAAATVTAAAASYAGDTRALEDAEGRVESLAARASGRERRGETELAHDVTEVTAPASVAASADERSHDREVATVPASSADTDAARRDVRRASDRERKRAAREEARRLGASPALEEAPRSTQIVMPWGADTSADTADIHADAAADTADSVRTQIPPLSDLKDLKNRKSKRGARGHIRADMRITPECIALFDGAVGATGLELAHQFVWAKFAAHAATKRWALGELEARWASWVQREIAYTVAARAKRVATEASPSVQRPTPGPRETRKIMQERQRWELEAPDRDTALRLAMTAIAALERTGT